MRAIAEQGLPARGEVVDVSWFDPWVKRTRIQYAPDDTLEFVPKWYGDRLLALGTRASGERSRSPAPSRPALLDDLDPVRAGRDRLPAVARVGRGRKPPRAQLDDPPVPDAGLGQDGPSRPPPPKRR